MQKAKELTDDDNKNHDPDATGDKMKDTEAIDIANRAKNKPRSQTLSDLNLQNTLPKQKVNRNSTINTNMETNIKTSQYKNNLVNTMPDNTISVEELLKQSRKIIDPNKNKNKNNKIISTQNIKTKENNEIEVTTNNQTSVEERNPSSKLRQSDLKIEIENSEPENNKKESEFIEVSDSPLFHNTTESKKTFKETIQLSPKFEDNQLN